MVSSVAREVVSSWIFVRSVVGGEGRDDRGSHCLGWKVWVDGGIVGVVDSGNSDVVWVGVGATEVVTVSVERV